jgi:hypothetical protein
MYQVSEVIEPTINPTEKADNSSLFEKLNQMVADYADYQEGDFSTQ